MLTREDEAWDAARLVCADLDGLLLDHGFAAGQIGVRPGEGSVIFCTPLRDLRRRFPLLAPDLLDQGTGACADLMVSVELDGEPRLASVHLDGHGLDALLRDAGLDARVPEAAALGRVPFAEARGRLHDLLAEVLERAASAAPATAAQNTADTSSARPTPPEGHA